MKTSPRVPVRSLLLFALFALLPLTGCIAVVAGGAAGGTLYATGDLKATLDAGPEAVREAIPKGAAELGLNSIEESADNLTGRYVFRTGDDTKVVIRYRSATDHATEISIRVGTFGDEALSTKILRAIEDAL